MSGSASHGAIDGRAERAETGALLRLSARLLRRARQENARAGLSEPRGGLEGVLSPGGTLGCTGHVAAAAFALLTKSTWPDVFIVLGTSHHSARASVSTADTITPFGTASVDRAVVSRLLERVPPPFSRGEPELTNERSWPSDLLLLQALAREYGRSVKVVAVTMGHRSLARGRKLGGILREILYEQGKRGCLIANGDLTHVGTGSNWEKAICARDHPAFAKAVAKTGFGALAPAGALMAFASDDGVRLRNPHVPSGAALHGRLRQAFTPADARVSLASIVFAHGGPRALRRDPPRALQLCPNVVVGYENGILHRCDGHPLTVSKPSLEVVRELVRGHRSIRSLAKACGGRFPPDDLATFVASLRTLGLLHSAPESLDDRRERADSMLKWSVGEVPFYARHPSRIAAAPFIDAHTVRLHWDTFTRRGAEDFIGNARKSDQRFSSGSTAGAKLRSVVEREVGKRRRGYENVVTEGSTLVRSKLVLGRPENLDMVWREGVAVKRGLRWVAVTPGPDPTAVKDADWDRVLELLVREDPECLEGDPAYLSGLAHRCLARGVELRRLSKVIIGHSFCWRIYAEPIERAFRQPIRSSLATSEFGIIGVTCDEGRLHLLETGLFFEIVANGRSVREGKVGALVVTTLDTQLRPLIRYVNGDVVRWVASECRCGRPYRVIEYEGRIKNLLPDRQGRFVTYRDIDALIGVPEGVRYFKLRETRGGFVLELVASCRESVPTSALRASLAARMGRHIAIRFLDSFGVRRGKHLAVETNDRYSAGLGHFFGKKERV